MVARGKNGGQWEALSLTAVCYGTYGIDEDVSAVDVGLGRLGEEGRLLGGKVREVEAGS